jgi:hypothetical protein
MAWAPNTPGTNDTSSLGAFLRVFSGETVAAYNKATLIKDKLRSRNISSGKSATFPTISTSSAKMHVPGDDLFTTADDKYKPSITNNEKIIQINQLLIDTSFVDNLDEMMNHFDARSEYASQMGAALATAGDQWAIGALARGATGATAAVTGSAATAASGTTAGTALLLSGMGRLAAAFDENHVPKTDRFCIVSPASYYGLMLDNSVVSSDFGKGGDRADPGQLSYLGITFINSAIWGEDFTGEASLVASTKVFNVIDGRTSYEVDLSKCYALGFQKEAAGVVSLKGMTTETDWIPERQGNLIVTKQAIGIDILRPTSSFLLKTNLV